MNILLDANILVYAHDPGQPLWMQRAIQILDELQWRGEGVLSVQCLAEFFSVVSRRKGDLPPWLSMLNAFNQVRLLAEVFQVFDLTKLIFLEASRGVRDHQLFYNPFSPSFDMVDWI